MKKLTWWVTRIKINGSHYITCRECEEFYDKATLPRNTKACPKCGYTEEENPTKG
ncbi:MAG: hypothetical protein BroJett011_33860 [Chloroflexota bacterium]|nr:MAG: hypothetical protein BroJett011_33860 [Chloroflexota bacterium]